MGKSSGFLEWPRMLPPKRDKRARVGDWREVYLAQTPDVTRQQGGRCMDCGIPFCHQGCPLGNLIPEWNDLVYRDRWLEAWRRLDATNNFPEFTGRLCPAPCETSCTLAINDDPVTIEQIEKEIIERAFDEGWVHARPPRERTGRHVAVVGSGPAGLAAAQQLNRAGHRVTVFEADERIGGLLRFGIPDFKMEKWVIDRRLTLMEQEGVILRPGVRVGEDPTWDALHAEHDAVVLGIGSQKPRELPVEGHDLDGVHFAMDFLCGQNRVVAGTREEAPIDVRGERVVILGGGDTGSDCLGTALRQGAHEVHQIELMERPPAQRKLDNPWPEWPMVLMTSSSQAEGGDRDWGILTKRLEGDGEGRLRRLHAVRIRPSDDGGLEEIPNSAFSMEVDRLILALGFTGPQAEALTEQLGVSLTERGNVRTDGTWRTNVNGVYAAGDAQRGQSLIVWAIADGRETARAVDADLRGETSDLPTKGRDRFWEAG